MAQSRILIVEDEKDILELHKYNLEKEGYTIFTAANGEEALRKIKQSIPDMVLLDLLLPGMDGLDVCRKLKSEQTTREIPVIMVTARGEDSDIIAGLEIGADDYVTKPFSPKVLLARIRNVLRRKEQPAGNESGGIIALSSITIDTARYEVRVADNLVELSATEFALLKLFAQNTGIVLSRQRIINAVKGSDYPVTERSVDVQILGLRRKLGEEGKRIKTVRGIGYRFKDEDT